MPLATCLYSFEISINFCLACFPYWSWICGRIKKHFGAHLFFLETWKLMRPKRLIKNGKCLFINVPLNETLKLSTDWYGIIKLLKSLRRVFILAVFFACPHPAVQSLKAHLHRASTSLVWVFYFRTVWGGVREKFSEIENFFRIVYGNIGRVQVKIWNTRNSKSGNVIPCGSAALYL